MDIVILGSGNVATQLAFSLKNKGYFIKQVYSQNHAHAKLLADQLGAEAPAYKSDITAGAAIYLIAVKDEAIETVAALLPKSHKGIVLHTSGSTNIDILKPYAQRYAVLYPLQTISKEIPLNFAKVPLILEFSDPETREDILNFAFRVSPLIYEYDSAQRRCLHLGAVLACNFSNYLYTIANAFLAEKKVDFNLLRPLIMETAEKVQEHSPADIQTGPASRRDHKIMDDHMQLLANHPDWKTLYQLISESIMKFESKKA